MQLVVGRASAWGHSHEGGGKGNQPSTPMQASETLTQVGLLVGEIKAQGGETRELVNSMRQMIVSNFQERMQLRRSLIEPRTKM